MKLPLAKQKKLPVLSEEQAGRILENVLETCHAEPMNVSLKTLISYSHYRRERFSFQKVLLVIIILLFCLLPFLFLTPEVHVSLADAGTAWEPVYHISVDCLLPVSRVCADLDGKSLLVTASDRHTYTVAPKINGTLTVSVTLANHQYRTETVAVTSVDTTAPACSSYEQTAGRVVLSLTDDSSGVDYGQITALDADGHRVMPLESDPDSGMVYFPVPQVSLDIYIPDRAGNTLHLLVRKK